MKCSNCKTLLLDHARFCHSCGEKTRGTALSCPSCATVNEAGSRYCKECGCALHHSNTGRSNQKRTEDNSQEETALFLLNFEDTSNLSTQIQNHFINYLNQQIEEEHDAKKLPHYRLCLYESGFIKKVELKAAQLAEESYTIHSRQTPSMQTEIDQLLLGHFSGLANYFLVEHTTHLNEFTLPNSILKYAGKRRNEVNLEQMIYDYLEWNKHPKEKFYTNFLNIPEHKIRNAAQSFLHADRKEKIFLLCDQTIFGSCKEGFAMTEQGLYWKAHFNKPYTVFYDNLMEIKKEQDWITINGRYFHVNKELDFRMLKLLKQLKEMY